MLTLRLHTGACDRTSAVTLLREFMRETTADEGHVEEEEEEEVGLGKAIEEMVPSGKGDKPFWARGIDVLGYSLNAVRFSNLSFVDAEDSNRRSQVVRMKLESDQTLKLVAVSLSSLQATSIIACAQFVYYYSVFSIIDTLLLIYKNKVFGF